MKDTLHGNIEDFAEEEYGSLAKRRRLAATPPVQLRGVAITTEKKNVASSVNHKLKASNFPATLLRIGSWEYVSKYESDLVAKCYYGRQKLVWEVLEGGLKSKIEIQWSDIVALKANCPVTGLGTLTIVLARRPAFFRETDPQPKKLTIWQATSDFTDGQASLNKKHFIQCLPNVLNKHFERLIQCDMRLNMLSRLPEIAVDSPYFESETSSCASVQSSSVSSGNTPVALPSVSKEAAISPSSREYPREPWW